jgi:transposase
MWCIPKLTPQFKENMDDILKLYTKPLPKGHEVHCFDELSKQLLGTPRGSFSCKPGQAKRTDYEYKRNGTRNIFVAVAPFKGVHTAMVTPRRTAEETADWLWQYCMKDNRLTRHIHLVMDNLNTHAEKSLRKVWGEAAGDQFRARVTIHYTPPHASWLNMAELEIGALRRQGLKARIGSEELLKETTAAIVKRRNTQQCIFNWKFNRKQAREKFPELYSGVRN